MNDILFRAKSNDPYRIVQVSFERFYLVVVHVESGLLSLDSLVIFFSVERVLLDHSLQFLNGLLDKFMQ